MWLFVGILVFCVLLYVVCVVCVVGYSGEGLLVGKGSSGICAVGYSGEGFFWGMCCGLWKGFFWCVCCWL